MATRRNDARSPLPSIRLFNYDLSDLLFRSCRGLCPSFWPSYPTVQLLFSRWLELLMLIGSRCHGAATPISCDMRCEYGAHTSTVLNRFCNRIPSWSMYKSYQEGNTGDLDWRLSWRWSSPCSNKAFDSSPGLCPGTPDLDVRHCRHRVDTEYTTIATYRCQQ